MDDELLQLEMKVSFAEDFMNQMNSIIIEQGKKIDRLIEINKTLQEKIALIEENVKDPRDNTPPPHY